MSGITGQDANYAPKVGVPGLPPFVDVRDVAGAHVKSLSLAAGVSERFLLCSGAVYYEDGLAKLRANGANGLGEEGPKIDLKDHFTLDASKAEKELGMDWIKYEQTTDDVYDWAVENGFIKG